MEESSKKKAFIIDSSYVLSFLLQESAEPKKYFEQLISGTIRLSAPTILSYEVGNTLRSAVLRKRIRTIKANALFEDYSKFTIEPIEVPFQKVLSFALKYNISFYDASYCYCAKSMKMPLLTFDAKLQKII